MESIKRKTKQSAKTNHLCTSLVSLFLFSLLWKYWPKLVRKYASFLKVVVVRLPLTRHENESVELENTSKV